MSKNSFMASVKWLQLMILAAGAGAVYFLPYVRSSYYDSLITALGVTNTQLGMIASAYGIFTIFCYFPGGWLADKISPRKLLTFTFISTAMGGFYYSTFPAFSQIVMLHMFFGITTTLTFWGAFIKAARQCGTKETQGKVFGTVEGVRRLFSTFIGLGTVAIFAKYVNETAGLRAVILAYSWILLILGILTWFLFKDVSEEDANEKTTISFQDIKIAFKKPAIWLNALIIICAYTSYSLADYLTPYLTGVCGVSAALGAMIATLRTYAIGPLGSISAGIIADKISSSKTIIYAFCVVIITNVLYIIIPGSPKVLMFVVFNMFILMTAHFAVRGVYYALLEEGKVPMKITGIAIGIIATIGYLPDAFIFTVAGHLLDTYPGVLGYKYIFTISTLAAALGLIFTMIFRKVVESKVSV